MHPVLLLAPLLVGAVAVEGSGACPAASDVGRRIATLAPGADGHVRLVHSEDGLVIELRDPEHRLLGRKVLGVERPCAELEQASALVAAAWLRRSSAEALPAPELPSPPPPPAPSPPVVAAAVGAGGALDVNGLAPGLSLALSVGGREWFASLGASGLLQRTAELAPGAVGYRRLSMRIAAGRRWELPKQLAAELQLGLLGALLGLEGKGFDRDLSATVPVAGLEAGARLEYGAARLRPWMGVEVAGWPRSVSASVSGAAARAQLPRWDVSLAAGLAWRSR